jgi:hypothetical protein
MVAMRVVAWLGMVACSGTIDGIPMADAPVVETDAPPPPQARLQMSFSTTTRNGQFAPNNCVVVWVEQNTAFVRTIERQCIVRRQYLVSWFAKATIEDNDAVSGATRVDHAAPVSFSWDLIDNGTEIADGTYTIRIELAEGNSTQPTQNNQGTFTFTKGPAPEVQSGLSAPGFTNVTIDYTPPP